MLFSTQKTKWITPEIAGNGVKDKDGEYIQKPVEFEIELLNTEQAEQLLADMDSKAIDGVGIYHKYTKNVRNCETETGEITDPKEFAKLPGTHEYVLSVTKVIMQYGLYGDALKNVSKRSTR